MARLSWLFALLAACGGASSATWSPPSTGGGTEAVVEAPPPVEGAAPEGGRLPRDVTPLHYALDLEIVPERDGFSGTAAIRVRLDASRGVIWMHGRNLEVTAAAVEAGGAPVEATWEGAADDDSFSALRLARAVGPGEATIRITYRASYDTRLEGLYKVGVGADSYAFTQMEPLSARLAFPGFDEPRFKTPFDVSITARREHTVIGNSQVVEELDAGGGMKRVRFATTEPIPTYLLCWAVGPLDVVEAPPIPPNEARDRPLPFRGVAPRGRGPELAHALQHTPEILAILERWFGIGYPYDKLDIIAVPDFESGAMENVGAITFRDSLLLIDEERASIGQLRGFAYVMAHELSHMWFGNLVTMEWWDDLWLNEALATWAEHPTIGRFRPSYEPEVDLVQSSIEAMGADSLVSARSIRNPIVASHDIHNAFDWITYSKGAAVATMFETWLGPETWQRGIRAYLAEHRFGSATADDFLRSLSDAAGRDVATPYRTFLTQAGVPFLTSELVCDDGGARLRVRQSRFAPIGSSAETERLWQVPVCVRFPSGRGTEERCELVTEQEGSVPLGAACPAWVMPNARGVGYYRWSLPPAQLSALQRLGMPRLSAAERLAFADSLGASFANGRTPGADVLAALGPLARDPHHAVASAPIELLRFVEAHLVDDPSRAVFERRVRAMYLPRYRALGLRPARGEAEGTRMLRTHVVRLLASVAQDPAVRRDAAALGRAYVGFGGDGRLHPEAVDPDLAGVALAVAVEEGEAPLYEAVLDHLRSSDDGAVRRRFLEALGAARDPALANRTRELALDGGLRANEMLRALGRQFEERRTRDEAWQWLQDNFDRLRLRMPGGHASWVPYMLSGYCAEERAVEVERFFRDRMERIPGGPRSVAGAAESIRLCSARADAQRESVHAWLAR